MKKIIVYLVLILVLLSVSVSAEEQSESGIALKIGETKAFVNGEYKTLDVPAEIINKRTFVPLRFCSEALGADVKYFDETRTAVIKKGNITLELTLEKYVYKINGELFESDALPILKNDRILVPVRVVSESLGTEVGWYEDTQIVTIGVLDNETAFAEYLKSLF